MPTAQDAVVLCKDSNDTINIWSTEYGLQPVCTLQGTEYCEAWGNIGEVSSIIFQIHQERAGCEKVYYIVDKREILRKAVSLWGTTLEKEMRSFTNESDDYARLIGVRLQESFCDKLDVLNDKRKSRIVLDDKANMSKKACFHAAAEDFCNSSITIVHPVCCQRVIDMHGDPCIKPNNLARISLPWTSDNMMSMYDSVMIKYKATMKNWTKGTGGGSGAPENYSTLQSRDEVEYFEGYAKVDGASHELIS